MDTQNLGANVGQWFEMGQRAGGRLSGVGQSLKVLVDTLKEDKALKGEIAGKKELLGYEAQLKKENRSPLEDLIDTGKVMDALTKMDAAGIDISGVMKGGAPQGITTGGQDITGLGSPQVAPVKATTVDEAQWIPQEREKTIFGGYKYGKEKRQPTQAEIEAETAGKVAEKQQLQLAEGFPTSEAGRVTLAKESIKNIQDVRNILFPTGKAPSFQRLTAYGSNPVLNWLPGVPQFWPGKQNPQDVYRKMSAALSGRQLIQTGVAARPEETAKLVSQFAPTGLSQSQSALRGLDELESFYKDYLKSVETRGISLKGKNVQEDNADTEYQNYLKAIGQ